MSYQATAAADALPYDVCGPMAFRVLVKLANVADVDGTRAFRHVGAMAKELGVSKRSVQRATKELQDRGLITLGDQRFTAHLPADKRPVVYDVCMTWATTWGAPELAGWDVDAAGDDELPSTACPKGHLIIVGTRYCELGCAL